MITVMLEVDGEGSLSLCKVSGHAECGPKGYDIVCAAVSILLRTTALVLENMNITVDTVKRGEFSLKILHSNPAESGRLQYAADFLRMGFISLEKEYPHAITYKQVRQ